MTPIDATIVILVLWLALNWLVLRHFDQLCDPAYLRRHGIVVTRDSALEARSAPIGQYLGRPIWGSVTFKGSVYSFHRVQPYGRREHLGRGELFLEPGLVYALSGVDSSAPAAVAQCRAVPQRECRLREPRAVPETGMARHDS